MKIHLNQIKKLQASAMMAVLLLAVVVAVTLAAYLVMVKNEYTQVGRSQTWNNSMVLAESGTEEGMALVNSSVTAGNSAQFQVTNWPSKSAANGWQNPSANVYFKSNNVDGTGNGGYYNVWITNNIGGTNPIIVSVGVANWNLGVASAAGPMFAMATALPTTQSQVTRQVYVQTSFEPIFGGAMNARQSIDMKGNKVLVDSFDSADPNYSTWNASWGYGTYNSAKHKAGGDVATDGLAINLQNANIYGHADTGPGGSVSVGSQGSVGPLGTPNGTSAAGWVADDMNVVWPDRSLPSPFPIGASSPITITNGGNVQWNNSALNTSLTIQGLGIPPAPINVTIYLPSGINYSGNQALNIGLNATVTIYSGGNIDVTGNATINNLTQNSANLSIVGLSTCTSIGMNGNSGYTGTIYAPSADFSFGGGGNNNTDFIGSIICNSVSLKGKANFHYDENLARVGPSRGFVPTIWTEVVAH